MADPLVLSGSSVGTYRRCPQRWYFEYIARDLRPYSLKMARGLAAHEAVALDLQSQVDTWEHLSRDEVVTAFTTAFEIEAKDSPETAKDTRADVLNRGILAVEAWHRDVAPTIEPVLVEVNGQFIINGVHYEWTADLLDAHGVLRDWKFAGSKPGKVPFFDYTVPMAGYATGLTSEGYDVAAAQLDYMVCTLNPYHHVIELDPPDTDEFGRVVRNTHDDIMAGHFPPLGLDNRSCSWCPYTDGTCSAYRRS